MPRSREREKRPADKKEKFCTLYAGEKSQFYNRYMVTRSPLGCGWLENPGVSQVEKEEHRRFFVYERCEVHLCFTAAAAAAVVPLLYCADACEIQRKLCRLEFVPR